MSAPAVVLLSLESVFILDLDIICPVSSLWVSVNCVRSCSVSAESRVRGHSGSGHYLPREQSLGLSELSLLSLESVFILDLDIICSVSSLWVSVNSVRSCSGSAESRVRVHSGSGHYLLREQSLGLSELCPLLQWFC